MTRFARCALLIGLLVGLPVWGLPAGLSAQEPDPGTAPADGASTGPADAGSSIVAESPVIARARVDRAEIDPGATTTLTVEVRYPAGWEIELPEVGQLIQGLAVVDFTRPDPVELGDTVELRRSYELRGDLAGIFPIPPVPVGWTDPQGARGTAATGPIIVTVSAEGEEQLLAEGLRDIAPALEPETDWRPWIYGGLGVLALGGLIGLGVWWVGRPEQHEEPPPRPPYEVALEALAALDEGGSLERDPRAWVTELDHLLRSYLEGRFAFPAREWTSQEIRRHDLSAVGPGLRTNLDQLLADADLVKFARHLPPRGRLQEMRQQAERLVRETKPAPPTEGEAADGEAGGTP